jgi:hypothetical protein
MNRLDTFGYFHLFECFDVQQKESSILPYFGRVGTKGARLGGCLSSFSFKWNLEPSGLNEGKVLALQNAASDSLH